MTVLFAVKVVIYAWLWLGLPETGSSLEKCNPSSDTRPGLQFRRPDRSPRRGTSQSHPGPLQCVPSPPPEPSRRRRCRSSRRRPALERGVGADSGPRLNHRTITLQDMFVHGSLISFRSGWALTGLWEEPRFVATVMVAGRQQPTKCLLVAGHRNTAVAAEQLAVHVEKRVCPPAITRTLTAFTSAFSGIPITRNAAAIPAARKHFSIAYPEPSEQSLRQKNEIVYWRHSPLRTPG